jgi:hypothetical protein
MKCPYKPKECKQLNTANMTKKVACCNCDWSNITIESLKEPEKVDIPDLSNDNFIDVFY